VVVDCSTSSFLQERIDLPTGTAALLCTVLDFGPIRVPFKVHSTGKSSDAETFHVKVHELFLSLTTHGLSFEFSIRVEVPTVPHDVLHSFTDAQYRKPAADEHFG
jgi:hypothetical protein